MSRTASGRPIRVGTVRLTPLGGGVVLLGLAASPLLLPTAEPGIAALALVTVVGCVVVGAVWPVVAVRRIRVALHPPTDASVGDDVRCGLDLSGVGGGAQVRLLDPAGPWVWTGADDPDATIVRLADARGVLIAARVEVASSAPLGIVVARRVVLVRFPRPLHVGPRRVTVDLAVPGDAAAGDEPRPAAALGGDTVRGVREYVAGDPAHLVHWPTTARTGTLVVRELEPPAAPRVALVVDLRLPAAERERTAAAGAALARAWLARGAEVLLATAEAGEPVVGQVGSDRDVGRRLAAASPGAPGRVPVGWPSIVVEVPDEEAS